MMYRVTFIDRNSNVHSICGRICLIGGGMLLNDSIEISLDRIFSVVPV